MSYIDHIVDCFSAFGPVEERAMFGGHGIFHAGLMIALVSDDLIYMKVDDNNREDYASKGMEPFTYKKKGKDTELSYWQLPEELLEDRDEMRTWAQKSFSAAENTQKNKKTKKKRKK